VATRFRFRLEPLLKLRKSLEQEAQRRLAKMMEARNAVEAHLQALGRQQHDALASRACPPGQAIDLAFWGDLERFLVVLEKRMLQTRIELEEAEERVVEARKGLTRAHQEYLMLLRLKERRQEQHALEALHEEIRESDEIAVLRYRFAGAGPARSASPGGAP